MDTSSELLRRNTGQFVNADFAGLASFTENQMVTFLRKTRVRDILAPRAVLTVTENQTVSHLLRLLQANSLKCAIIATTEEVPPRAIGFVDAYDIAMTALDAMGWRDINDDKVAQMILEAKSFAQRDVCLIPVVSQRDPINARNSDTSLFDIAVLFAGGLHRVLIVDNGMMTNIISQSDIARALVSRLDLVGERARIQIKDTFLVKAQLHTISLNSHVVDALNKMRAANITGLPVVDDKGRLVSSFSSSDVLNITEDTFHYAAFTVQEFLTRTCGFVRPAVVCKKEDTFENLLFKFVVFGIHRIFVIDNNYMPIGLVTLTDVMGFVVSP